MGCKHHKKKKGKNKKNKQEKEEEDDENMIIRENPFLQLGYGINAHLDTLYNMSCFFLTMTIVCIPIYVIYFGNKVKALKTDEPNPFA